jgi:hypothetical protein
VLGFSLVRSLVDSLAGYPGLEISRKGLLPSADDQSSAGNEAVGELRLDLALEWRLEVGEDQVSAKNQIEASLGMLLASVLEPEIHPSLEALVEAELFSRDRESSVLPGLRKVAKARFPITRAPRSD